MPADSRSVRAEAAHLLNASVAIRGKGVAIVRRGALELKRQLQSEAKGVAHAPALPSAITYESFVKPASMGFEVGPVKGGAGSLALLYYGNSKTGAVLKDPRFALEREATEVTRRLLELVVAQA